ncbi:MAG: hypothetical protein NTY09_12815 [bacterium]|nr:hypothetical protein [bacterium]
MRPEMSLSRLNTLAFIAGFLILSAASPAFSQTYRPFEPIPRGEMYEQQFLADFFDALGTLPANLSLVDQSETVRLLVMAGSTAERGDTLEAISMFGLLPDVISAQFPFITTMKEDLQIPDILQPWYQNEDARNYLFSFYEEAWLPHPEYRDDYISYRDDTMGRASRRDPTVPAVWILGHLADYGFVPDRELTDDDPYLFLWDLLTSVTVYAQRCGFYGLQYDQYNELAYKTAVVNKVGEKIYDAHQEASRRETGRGFWSDLINSHNPFEVPAQNGETGTETTPVSGAEETGTTASGTSEAQDDYDLFRPPPETAPSGTEESTEDQAATDETIEGLVNNLEDRMGEVVPPAGEAPAEEVVTEETPVEETPVEETITEEPGATTDESTATVETPVEETITEEPGATTDESTATEETPEQVTEEVPGEGEQAVPDEFQYEGGPDRTPSETAPEEAPPGELGNYATVRLKEIADQLAVDIGALANDLGSETIDLVVLYNDVNVTDETIVNAEQRYIAKREAFLAGLAVWDRFNMEIYTPLTLADFNDLVAADLNSPYLNIKANAAQWAQVQAYEAHFDEAFAQIEDGLRNRRDETDVMAAEAAALTAFLGDFNDRIKEIEDLLSGAITAPPEGTTTTPE